MLVLIRCMLICNFRELAQSNLVLAAMETESEITHSQLDSTISSSIDVNQPIIANPHPLILRDQGKMKLLQKWERKFKEGMINSSRSCQVKLETKDKDISQNVTHFIVEDLGSWEKTVNIDGCYSAPLYQALLMGAWILDFNWITSCLKDEQILDEEQYVVSNYELIPLSHYWRSGLLFHLVKMIILLQTPIQS